MFISKKNLNELIYQKIVDISKNYDIIILVIITDMCLEVNMAELKKSKQRQAILDFLSTRKDHPTADTVYSNVREVFPNISLGTVYRNLQLLTEMGTIQKLKFYDGQDHFDYNASPHSHFICDQCGCVLDLDYELDPSLNRSANANFGGKILGHVIYFHGLCPNCSNASSSL